MRVFINVFGLLSVVVILVSLVLYLTVKSLLAFAAVGLLGGMVCLLIYIAVSFERLSAFFTRQSTKYGLNLLVTAVVLLLIIGLVEVIASRNNKRFDLTAEKTLTLSPLTKKVLKSLDQEVKITVFYQRDKIFEFRDLLKRYKDETDKISSQFFNLDQNPGMAKEYRIGSYGGTVVESQERRRSYNYCTEENVTNGIISVTREEAKVIYFLEGHGERDVTYLDKREGYSHASSALEAEGYVVKSLLLLREEKIPDDVSVLVVSGPKEELLPTELQAISDYVLRGGNVLFMIDPYTVPKLVEYLKGYNILVGKDMVVDKENKLFAGDIFTSVVLPTRGNPITQNYGVATVFPLVCSVEPLVPTKSDRVLTKSLATTSPGSWAETNRESIKKGEVYFQEWEDKNGPVSVVVLAEVSGKAGGKDKKGESEDKTHKEEKINEVTEGRVVVCGDSDFASNLYLPVLGNKDFFLNMISWLAEQEELISIRHKKEESYPFSPLFLTENQKKAVFWFSVVIQPLIILSIGILIYTRRKIRG
ncbi:MAG: GldG family protein [Deltaproteobacteria bacterium]|nr:GldG family protein [Deltaproteobacteria bacterium]